LLTPPGDDTGGTLRRFPQDSVGICQFATSLPDL
jgi:hypothetical protein